MVKEAILKSGNQYLFTIPYSPVTNAVEMYFNQIKTHIKKNRDVYTFDGLEKNVDKAIDKVKTENYKNYFLSPNFQFVNFVALLVSRVANRLILKPRLHKRLPNQQF